MTDIIAKYSAMLWLLVFGPKTLVVYARCIITLLVLS